MLFWIAGVLFTTAFFSEAYKKQLKKNGANTKIEHYLAHFVLFVCCFALWPMMLGRHFRSRL